MRIASSDFSDVDIDEALAMWYNACDPDRIGRRVNLSVPAVPAAAAAHAAAAATAATAAKAPAMADHDKELEDPLHSYEHHDHDIDHDHDPMQMNSDID